MSYSTIYKETHPFKVFITKMKNISHVAVLRTEDGNEVLVSTFIAKNIMIGKSPKCNLTSTGTFGSEFDGNTILLHLRHDKYVYIGKEIIKFTAFGEINEFVSPVDVDRIPYSYAVDGKNNTYLFNEQIVLMNLTSKNYSNPYDYYEDHRTIVSSKSKSSKKPKHTISLSLDEKDPEQLIEIYVSDEQLCVKHESRSAMLYNRLTGNEKNKMYVVFSNEPDKMVSIDIGDFKKILSKFGSVAHFKPFKNVYNL